MNKLFNVAAFIMLLSGNVFAQQNFDLSTLGSMYQLPMSGMLPSYPTDQLQYEQVMGEKEPVAPAQAKPAHLAEEQLSEFEQFVSEKVTEKVVEISETQFNILKRYREITFSNHSHASPGNIAIPIRIVTADTPSKVIDAGFLIGQPDVMGRLFKILSIRSPLTISMEIRQFGYRLFREPPSTFAPVNRVPVGPDYVLGPGDGIRITVWGKMEGKWSVVVDRDGNISLPKIGVLGVTNLTFNELKELLNKEFSKYYTGFEMNVSMGALRTMRVYVVGNAVSPGAYTVSSLSTIVNALFESGGPNKTGTMRDIQLKRNGKTVVHFDIYDLFLNGDKTKDVRLMPEDVIFIPPVGPLVAIAGSVNNPAIYEIKGENKVTQLIEMAGGVSVVAFKGRVQIERIFDHDRQVVFESSLEDIKEKAPTLQGGDVARIFQVVEEKRTVWLSGAVHREGEYGLKPGMAIKDLISLAGGLKQYAYNKEAELSRTYITDKGPQREKISVNLEKAMTGDEASNISLREDDYLFVRTIPEWRPYRTATISGEVRFPGTYGIYKGEKLSSLIDRAGGFTDKAYLKGAAFTRESVRDLQQKNLEDAMDRIEQQMLSQSVVSAQTALSAEEAGHQKAAAEQQKALIAKMRIARAKGRMVLKLDSLEKFKESVYDVELETGDILTVPDQPSSIQVIGSIYNSTAFIYDPGKTISSYIEKAGGTTKFADGKEIFILKSDGSAVTRKHGGMFFMSSRLDPGDTVVVPEKLERIAWMREIKDITQILYQIAVTAGVLIVAF
mgnify:FL=1